MPYLTQLADVARRTGYPVTEVPGWRTRGHGPQPAVEGVVCHHTGGPPGGGDYPSLRVVVEGRADLLGPLSHYGLGRSGRIYVIAAGRCWHNAPSTSARHDNSSSIGIEAENSGAQPWPPAQLDAYRRLVAELCEEFGLTAAAVMGHREVNRAKVDPAGVDMTSFRAAVARLMKEKSMTGDAVFRATWFTDAIPVPWGTEDNPEWQARSILVDHGVQLRKILATLDAQGVTIRELVAALAAHDQEIDVDALVGRIESAIEGISVRLDVPDSA